jgi:drug/metabolite transporter (DMT)-like permease
MLLGCFFTAWMSQFAHLLKDACDWRVTALARTALAFVFALGLARLSGARLVVWRPITLWLRSCASSTSLLCMFFALTQLPTSEVLTLTNTFPIWVAFLSWPLLRTRPTLSVWLAAGCGVLGVALIQSPNFEAEPGATLALALSLTAALTNAIAMLGLHRLKGVHAWAIVVHYSGVATVCVLASWCIGGLPEMPALGARTVLLLLGVGVAATLGQVFVTLAFTTGQPARVSVVGLMQIVFALGLDLLIHGPNLQPVALLGIGLVLAPTAWMMAGKAKEQEEHASEPKSIPIRAPHQTASGGRQPPVYVEETGG